MKRKTLVFKDLYATLVAIILAILVNFTQNGAYSIGEIFLFGINFFILYAILLYLFDKLGYKL